MAGKCRNRLSFALDISLSFMFYHRYFIRFTKLQAICVLFEPEGFTYEFVNNSKNFTVKFQRRVF